jgi:predicted DNA-binding protein (MmcQ/YjbR family)
MELKKKCHLIKNTCFKVNNKIYTLTDIELFEFINLKFKPDRAEKLRISYH